MINLETNTVEDILIGNTPIEKVYLESDLMLEKAPLPDYVSSGLVFHLDAADATAESWIDKINGVVLTPHDITLSGGVVFAGNVNSYYSSSAALNVTSANATIEIVHAPGNTNGFLLENKNGNIVYYMRNLASISFYHVNHSCAIASFTSGKVGTHSISNTRNFFNKVNKGFTGTDHWSAAVSNLIIGKRGNNTRPYKGTVYQIRVYNRNLTEEEVLFNQTIDMKKYNIK